jgi:hypothetical protein
MTKTLFLGVIRAEPRVCADSLNTAPLGADTFQ